MNDYYMDPKRKKMQTWSSTGRKRLPSSREYIPAPLLFRFYGSTCGLSLFDPYTGSCCSV